MADWIVFIPAVLSCVVVALFILFAFSMSGPTQDESPRVPYVTTELATAIAKARMLIAHERGLEAGRRAAKDAESTRGTLVMLRVAAIHLESEGGVQMAKAVRDAIDMLEKEADRV